VPQPPPSYLPPGAVALRRELLLRGAAPDELTRDLRRGALVRVRHGAYTDAHTWLASSREQRHLLAARAVQASLQQPAVLSHATAALALGLPVWGVDLGAVHVTRPERAQARREAGVVHHRASLPDDEIVQVDGLLVTSPTRTVLDLARLAGLEPGVVTADAALHRGLTTTEGLLTMANARRDWPGSRVIGRVLAMANGLSESVGESRSRVMCHRYDLPPVRPQVEMWDGAVLLGRVDLYIERWRTVIEFDGRVKYRIQGLDDPAEIQEVLWAEKRREDSIRALGNAFCRLIWVDLDRPHETVTRIRRIGLAHVAALGGPWSRLVG
jgi:hypothetical protein